MRMALIQINVLDLQTAWDFYVRTLGIPGEWVHGENRAFELGVGEIPVLVYPVSRHELHSYPDTSGTVLVFGTEDIDKTHREWKAKGVQFIPIAWSQDDTGIAPSPYGRFVAFSDPFGNVHELVENQ